MTRWYLGKMRRNLSGSNERIYLEDFKWDCEWYWAGGYLGNENCHFHFDGAFLNVPDKRSHPLGRFITNFDEKPEHGDYKVLQNSAAVWEPIETFLEDVPAHISVNWWRIKDLFKQYYVYKAAAEAFQYGGHCTSQGRNPAEIKPIMAASINSHIEHIIVPEIRKIFNSEEND